MLSSPKYRHGIGLQTESLIGIARESGRVVRLVGRARIWQGRVRVRASRPNWFGPIAVLFGVGYVESGSLQS